jgi:hypothetical protein
MRWLEIFALVICIMAAGSVCAFGALVVMEIGSKCLVLGLFFVAALVATIFMD